MFDPLPDNIDWRLWYYDAPGIKQLSLPRDQPLDIALLAIDGRITAIKHAALCRPNDCAPIAPEFEAIAIVVARPGQFLQAGLEPGSSVEYGHPSNIQEVEISALK